jgi:serine/threonine-protein kinase
LRVDDEGQVHLLDWGDGRALRADTLAADVQALGRVLQALRGAGRARSGMADADLAAVQARAQAADAAQRYASVQALSEDLQLVSTHRPVPGAHASPWHRAQLFVRRRRLALAAGALGLLLLAFVVNLGVRYLVQGQGQVQRGQQVQEFLRDNQLDAAAAPGSTPETAPDVAQEAPRLQRALEKARLGFAGEPVLRGQVLVELGVRFRMLGQPEQALAVLREAVALLRSTASAAEPALHLARAQLALQLLQNQTPAAAAEARTLVEPIQSTCSGAACEQALGVARQVGAVLATTSR